MSYEEDIAWGIQQMLDADLQFPQDVPVRNVVKTNADHIRSMTDEELAEWMEIHNVSCGICSEYVACGGEVVFGDKTCDCDCATHYLNWLKQPYKEDT